GAVRFPQSWSDYRRKPVPAGVYTLRYALQPQDGNHTGSSMYRDFLLLGSPAFDAAPEAAANHAQAVDVGKKASAAPHPWVMALFPLSKPVAEPQMVKNELEQWM